jgi:SSS family solute:Na+ symporter
VVSYSIVIIYTSFGGLKSVITNNILQFFTMIIAIPALTIFGIREIGFDHFIDNVPVSKYSLSDNKLLWDTIWLTLSFSVMGCYPTLIQRALLNKNSTYMTSAMVIKSIVYVFFIICIALNGLIALQIMPGALGNEALQYTINTIMPNGLKGLVVIGFLAATMSTADTDLNVASVSSAQDIFKPLFKMSNQDNLLFFARVASVAIGGISILISITFDSIVDIVLTVAGLWAPIMLVPFLSVVFNKTISQRGLVVSIISGMIGLILWLYLLVP